MAAQPRAQATPQEAPFLEEGASPDKLLRLDNQLCFPLYACSKEVVRSYQPLLGPLGLTYTQYLCMMVLWEEGAATVSHLGERLYLDSGTLTPVLRKLEERGYVTRERSAADARVLEVRLTPEGRALRDRAASVPRAMACHVHLSADEAVELKRLLAKVLESVHESETACPNACAQEEGSN
ncbi:MAG: MarR family transcriptional regulator [Olsenella sp.]|nr:MarR family transcriptional regulator [Olsenella sp.]MCH3957825.1 MarR family transcriptional regulator [Olsenella sp.]MCI1645047.1 MarR family transcriptional regulator [Olsenella sp.]MCI1667955.1 MarR family transcriptional regulator [Olsenella sp.]MCI1794459.1 MarR family transcriptional regulator [Olsenella sp.]